VSGTTATGEVYCIAHHLRGDAAETTDLAVYIRYLDRYRQDPGGRWLIESRQGVFLWTEERPVMA
jgi:SnoaL-like domain